MMVAFSKLHLLRCYMPHIPLRCLWGFLPFFSRYFSGSRLDYSSGGWKCVNVRFGRSLPVPRAGCREEIRVRPTNRRFHNSLWCVSGCKVRGGEGAKTANLPVWDGKMKNESWGMGNDGRISDAPFVLLFYAPHSASLHVGFSTIYASPKRIRILRV